MSAQSKSFVQAVTGDGEADGGAEGGAEAGAGGGVEVEGGAGGGAEGGTTEEEEQPRNNHGTVPCIAIASNSGYCPHGGPEGGCTFCHREPCLYSVNCRKMQDEEHMNMFYHPRGKCKMYRNCNRADDNHHLLFAHKCMIEQCERATIANLNGWVCGLHFQRMIKKSRAVRTGVY